MPKRVIAVLVIALVVPVMVPVASQATIHVIKQSGFSFSPLGTTVHYGDTVRWIDSSGTHTTTSDVSSAKSWDSGTMTAIQQFDQVFFAGDGPGPFPYHCNFHVTFGMVDTIRVATSSCCVGKRGNVNCTGVVDLGDLSALVSYLTGGGFVLCCFDAANVNGTGTVDLGDLSALVSYLTGGGFVLPNCP